MGDKKNFVLTITGGILDALKEGLSLWKQFIGTRQEAYNRKKDMRKEKALHYAEQSFDVVNDYFNYVFEHVSLDNVDIENLTKIKKEFYKIKKKFDKYD